jgi:glutamate synthase (NADPH/NADH) small chain
LLVGSGPASLIAAYDLARKGYRVTVFEALHELGGVLAYGIPPFRLPPKSCAGRSKGCVHWESSFVRTLVWAGPRPWQNCWRGVFAAVFVGTGAGLLHLMGIPSENLIGVYTADEFLTRINRMRA